MNDSNKNKWTAYGQWRHPLMWWTIALKRYLSKSDINTDDLNIVKITQDQIEYSFGSNLEVHLIDKATITENSN